jgi:hypothetical protein
MKKSHAEMMGYPNPIKLRVGCKVSWYYYRTKKEANKASHRAETRAKIKEAQGYDWGYQTPGNVRLCEAGEFAGLWEVVIP